ncbi:MAG: aldo/keto reductase [Bacteroidota bacterium]
MKILTYANNDQMPALGLGTWKSDPGVVKKAIIKAIEIGYRHIDCAAIYGNETEIGEALEECLKKGMVKRADLWITSKLWNDAHKREDVQPALEKTLADLKLDYLDLYLMHWPVAFKNGVSFPENSEGYLSLDEAPLTETWLAMQELQKVGLVKHIGTSNFSIHKLQQLIALGGQKPEMNQVELHPYLQQQGLIDFCHQNNIHITAYSPLGSMDRPEVFKKEGEPIPLQNATIAAIATDRGISPAQVLLAWPLHRKISVIPKSTNPKRLKENFEANTIALNDEEMDTIAKLDQHERIIDGSFFVAEEKGYTVKNLWDE